MAHSKTAPIDQHDWEQVPPVVATIGQGVINGLKPYQLQAYNAVCACGAKAWVHWPARPT